MKYTIKFGKQGTWIESVATGLIGFGVCAMILVLMPLLVCFLICLAIVLPILGLFGVVYLKETK